MYEPDCETAGGIWHYEWGSCSTAECPQPLRACCFPNGSCQIMEELDCETAGGIWHFEWASCSTAQCPQPEAACCFPDGSCLVYTENYCQQAGGIWHPEWANCSVADCPQPDRACCFPDGSCQIMSQGECEDAGGILYSELTCSPNPCPTYGACCYGQRECEITTQNMCGEYMGVWHPEWLECLPSICHEEGPPCPPAGSDSFDETHAVFIFQVPGQSGPRPIVALGPTTVVRAQPQFFPDGQCVIQTEITQLDLAGVYDPAGTGTAARTGPTPVTITLIPTAPTLGTITSSIDGQGNPDFPDDSQFSVRVMVNIEGVGSYPHTVFLRNMLTRGDLWGDPPCVDPEGPYVAPSNDHAHIPCPPGNPPTGGCALPETIGGGCFVTYREICDQLGGTYLGDGV
ncbi:MAG: hypothetical protein GY778_17195, partial [bacterium]|nr:hypothetical protein [bacterium]